MRTPKGLEGTVLRGELIAVDKAGNAIRGQELFNSLVNSSTAESRKKQKETGYHLFPAIYDVDRYKGKDVSKVSYEEKKKILEEVRNKVPRLHVPEGERDPKKQAELFQRIKSGDHPLTDEGAVFWNLSSGVPTKVKNIGDFDVHVRNFFQEKDKNGNPKPMAGGFEFSWEPDGPIVGRVGTGFNHAQKKDMWENQDKYVGRVARVKSRRKLPKSGALFQPSFMNFHLEKGEFEKGFEKEAFQLFF